MTGVETEPAAQSNGGETVPAAATTDNAPNNEAETEAAAATTDNAPNNGGDTEATAATTDNTPSALELNIIRQIEYYFGDINLPRDKFLQEQLKLEDGWVPLEVLTKFHRLAKLSSDTAVIGAALAKATSGLMELSEDSKKVRRNPEQPLPELNEERRKELQTRSVYVKGFPKDATVDICLKFFSDHPVVENVLMRRYQERESKKWNFKGSVFVTFKTRDQAEAFLKREGLKYGETELEVKWQEEYLKAKQEEFASKKDKGKNKNSKEKKEENKEEIKLPLGAILHFTNIADSVSREQIKETLKEAGAEVAFVDFNKGDKEGWVRLQSENTAQQMYDKMIDGKLKIDESEVTFKVLGGEEEKSFLVRTVEEMAKRRSNANKNKHNSKGKHHHGGHRNHGGHRKRKQGAHPDAPPQKVKAE